MLTVISYMFFEPHNDKTTTLIYRQHYKGQSLLAVYTI